MVFVFLISKSNNSLFIYIKKSDDFSILVCSIGLLQLPTDFRIICCYCVWGSSTWTSIYLETTAVLYLLSQPAYIQFPFLVILCCLHFQSSVQ